MRWDTLRFDAETQAPGTPGPPAVPALFEQGSVTRTFDTPAFRGMTFFEVHARSVINRVPEASRVPFRWTINPYRGCSHACRYCLWGETPILMADGRTKPLAEVHVGDAVYGTARRGRHRRYVATTVLAHWQAVKPAYRVTLADGTRLIASADHRFLTGRGWKYVTGAARGAARRPHLTPSNELMGVGRFAEQPKDSPDYRRGYLCGTAQQPVHWPSAPSLDWRKGFLAGIFDAAGSCAGGVLRISSTDRAALGWAIACLASLGFGVTVAPASHANGPAVVRLRGGLRERLRFFHTTDPAITRKRTIEGAAITSDAMLRVVAVEPLGFDLPMYDITTGTGDFIANGVVSHNCFARNTHTYLDLDAGHDFDSKIVVKVNAPQLVRKELGAARWRGEPIAMGTNVDCYQRAEGRYRLMPGILTALRDYANPFSILTKGTLVLRDLDLLQQSAEVTDVGLAVSVGCTDEDLWRVLEPGTPSPARRLGVCATLTGVGLPCAVLMGPVVPFLSDSPARLADTVRQIAQAGASSVTPIVLHLRPGAREWFFQWLAEHEPGLVPRYRAMYARGAYAPKAYQERVAEQVRALARRYGVGRGAPRPRPHRAGGRQHPGTGHLTAPQRPQAVQATLL
ncbi:MAG TPA: intein-containing Rv2578c family radical SAM protein [Streptosporangiaceae bacterium]|nr:intein-containing Rv2578c family radical SAM protein [Streptosporangiaceae bacterium]